MCCPKPGRGPLFAGLLAQLAALRVPLLPADAALAALAKRGGNGFDVVVDAVFGFSFSGAPRPPFDALLAAAAAPGAPPVVSVDLPSGWDVDAGPARAAAPQLSPAVLVSLTAPKLGVRGFTGRHYLGGRGFVPPGAAAELGLRLPPFEGTSQVVLLHAGE